MTAARHALYERPADRDREDELAVKAAQKWDARQFSTRTAATADRIFLRAGRIVAVAELKVRKNPRAQYPTLMISFDKVLRLRLCAELLQVPPLLIVGWADAPAGSTSPASSRPASSTAGAGTATTRWTLSSAPTTRPAPSRICDEENTMHPKDITSPEFGKTLARGAGPRLNLTRREAAFVCEWARLEADGLRPNTTMVSAALGIKVASGHALRVAATEYGFLTVSPERYVTATPAARALAAQHRDGARVHEIEEPGDDQAVVTYGHVCTVLWRGAEHHEEPERLLWLTVLCNAVKDLCSNADSARRSAHAFFFSPLWASWFADVCGFAGLEPVYVRELVEYIGRPIRLPKAS